VTEQRFPEFQERFNELRQSYKSQEKFAEFLGMSRPTVGFYENGTRIPDILTLKNIAKKCNVSADWLLGLSDEKTVNADIKAVCKYTGLFEDTVSYLHDTTCNKAKPILQLFIDTLANNSLWFLIDMGITQLNALRERAYCIDISPQMLSELFELEREVDTKSHGLFQMQPIHEQIEQVYSNTLGYLGLIIDKITDCNKAKEAASEKWGEVLRMARHSNALHPKYIDTMERFAEQADGNGENDFAAFIRDNISLEDGEPNAKT